jgi:basic membrane protein A
MIKSKKMLAFGMVAALGVAACGSDDDGDSGESDEGTEEESASTEATDDEGGEEESATTEAMEEEGGEEESATTEAMEEEGEAAAEGDCAVGMAFDVTGRGDKSFNDAAGAALDQAVEELGISFTESTPTGDGDRAERVQGLVDDGAGLVQGNGFLFTDALAELAPNNPDTSFTLVDSVVEADNVTNLLFAEEQGSFLVGAAAALKSESGIIGFVGGVENDLIKKFEAGYAAGAEAVNPDIEVEVSYISQPPDFTGFNDPARGKEIAAAQYEAGADVVYSAAGSSGLGAFEAAVEAGEPGEVWAIGVDSDQYELVSEEIQPYILTSMLKKVDVATFNAISDFCAGNLEAGIQIFDLSVGGVGYSTSGGFVDDIAGDLDAFAEQIIAGDIEVPTAP